jgi:hypothetical protein
MSTTYASIYTMDGGEITTGLQPSIGGPHSPTAIAERAADNIGADVHLIDSDGEWIVHPAREDGTRDLADPYVAD